MTCIVGFVENSKVYIGGDSAGVSGYDIRIRADEKVFYKEGMIFGFTSSFRMGQILQYSFEIPDHPDYKGTFEYLCSDFIDALIKCFKEKGYATISENEVSGGSFLLGYRGKLYHIESDFQVSTVLTNFSACGCGTPYALGAFKVLEDVTLSPKSRITKVLETASYFSAGVEGPFNIVNI